MTGTWKYWRDLIGRKISCDASRVPCLVDLISKAKSTCIVRSGCLSMFNAVRPMLERGQMVVKTLWR